jgi:superfamily II DNA or RNA helicase
MSATPNRRDGKQVLFKDYFSPLFIEAEEYRYLLKPAVYIKRMNIDFEVRNPTLDWARALTKVYSNDIYLKQIAKDTISLIADGRKCLLLGLRTEALAQLQMMIPKSKVLDGTIKKKEERKEILDSLDKDTDCILSTTIFDEGLSCHRLDTLILTEPVGKNFDKLEQRIGRIQRIHPDKQPILLQVYWLQNHILKRQQSVELRWYQYHKYEILS